MICRTPWLTAQPRRHREDDFGPGELLPGWCNSYAEPDYRLTALMPTGDSSVTYPDYTFTPSVNHWGLECDLCRDPDRNFPGLVCINGSDHAESHGAALAGPRSDHAADRGSGAGTGVSIRRLSPTAIWVSLAVPTLTSRAAYIPTAICILGVSNGATLTFHDKITAYGNVIRTVLPNGLAAAANNDSGTVDILTAAQGCDGTQPACRAIAATEGSVTGAGGNPPQSRL